MMHNEQEMREQEMRNAFDAQTRSEFPDVTEETIARIVEAKLKATIERNMKVAQIVQAERAKVDEMKSHERAQILDNINNLTLESNTIVGMWEVKEKEYAAAHNSREAVWAQVLNVHSQYEAYVSKLRELGGEEPDKEETLGRLATLTYDVPGTPAPETEVGSKKRAKVFSEEEEHSLRKELNNALDRIEELEVQKNQAMAVGEGMDNNAAAAEAIAAKEAELQKALQRVTKLEESKKALMDECNEKIKKLNAKVKAADDRAKTQQPQPHRDHIESLQELLKEANRKYDDAKKQLRELAKRYEALEAEMEHLTSGEGGGEELGGGELNEPLRKEIATLKAKLNQMRGKYMQHIKNLTFKCAVDRKGGLKGCGLASIISQKAPYNTSCEVHKAASDKAKHMEGKKKDLAFDWVDMLKEAETTDAEMEIRSRR